MTTPISLTSAANRAGFQIVPRVIGEAGFHAVGPGIGAQHRIVVWNTRLCQIIPETPK